MLLTATKAYKLPTPPQMNNHGNYIVSLGNVCRWLGAKAEALGVEIYPGFAASETIIEDGQVKGVVAGVMGIRKDGSKGPNYEPGMELRATYTLFAEGCRGSLTKKLLERYDLRDGVAPQTYRARHEGAVGDPEGAPHARAWCGTPPAGRCRPTPMAGPGSTCSARTWSASASSSGSTTRTPGCRPSTSSSASRPTPRCAKMLEGGKRIAYGARALNEGGFQAIPKLVFPGGMLIGDTAGFLNVPKIKGTHTAMKSGMVAAEAVAAALAGEERPAVLDSYPEALKAELGLGRAAGRPQHPPGLRQVRAVGRAAQCRRSTPTSSAARRPGPGRTSQDHETLKQASEVEADRVPEAGRQADLRPALLGVPVEHQPRGGPAGAPQAEGSRRLEGRELGPVPQPGKPLLPGRGLRGGGAGGGARAARHAGCRGDRRGRPVEAGDAGARLVINAQNCVHCKTCDIKDPGPEHRLDHAARAAAGRITSAGCDRGRGASWRASDVRFYLLDPYSHAWLTDWCWSLICSWKDAARSSRLHFPGPVARFAFRAAAGGDTKREPQCPAAWTIQRRRPRHPAGPGWAQRSRRGGGTPARLRRCHQYHYDIVPMTGPERPQHRRRRHRADR